MKRKKYITPKSFCIPFSTENSVMQTVSQKTKGAGVVDDGTELGAKKGTFYEDDDFKESSE
jgi:hypothetical protein